MTSPLWTTRSRIARKDRRRSEVRAILSTTAALIGMVGPNPTPQQIILVDRVVFLLYRITLYESAVLGGKVFEPATDANYLAWVNVLRRLLETLGIARKLPDLKSLRELLPLEST